LALRRSFGLPGMRVLQFAFDGSADNPHLPRNYTPDTVAYTGTTTMTRPWAGIAPSIGSPPRRSQPSGRPQEGGAARDAAGRARLVAVLAVVPVQDVLGLGSEARFKCPYGRRQLALARRIPAL